MLIKSLWISLVLAGAADELVTLRLASIRIKAPAAWSHTVEEGTHRFVAPSGDANFTLDTGKTAQPMDAGVCLGKITSTLGGQWVRMSIGAAPAAKRLEMIHNDKTGGDIYEYAYVGCDGVHTWSLIFRLDAQRKDRFAALGERVAASLEYIRGS
jgi:hypothetical protein